MFFIRIKKRNFIPIIALFMGLCSCDGPRRLLVNERNNYIIDTECGTIDISSSWFSTTTIKIVFNGEYRVLLDSIKIIGTTQNYDYQNELVCSFYKDGYESAEIMHTDTVLNVSNGNVLTYDTKERPPFKKVTSQFYEIEDKYLILQNAIYCNGKVVPIDTIRVEGLFSKDKRKKR